MNRHLFKEDKQVAHKDMKRCPTSLVIKKCKSKPQQISLHIHEKDHNKSKQNKGWVSARLAHMRPWVQSPLPGYTHTHTHTYTLKKML
jgi:hypothetical protein